MNPIANHDIFEPFEENEGNKKIMQLRLSRSISLNMVVAVATWLVTSLPTVTLPMGNHYGYIKENERVTRNIPRTK